MHTLKTQTNISLLLQLLAVHQEPHSRDALKVAYVHVVHVQSCRGQGIGMAAALTWQTQRGGMAGAADLS